MEPLNFFFLGHIGASHFVRCREVLILSVIKSVLCREVLIFSVVKNVLCREVLISVVKNASVLRVSFGH